MRCRDSAGRTWRHLVSSVFIVVLSAVGCSSLAGEQVTGNAWSRSYVLPYDRVWAAAVASLSSSRYIIEEQDPAKGQIRAESTDEPAYRAVVLVVRVDRRDEDVRVHVQASGGGVESPAEIGRLDRAVNEYLDELDDRLGTR